MLRVMPEVSTYVCLQAPMVELPSQSAAHKISLDIESSVSSPILKSIADVAVTGAT